ncbi:hypothetical protein B0A50_04717 [Salinomyces thailandicus]|uniref:TRUD domain-containing protein n=1 Tax=Salinomyces thailandicus TaxID=706561 RepID=A0A4V5N5U1_9PEZI|nr:hypothetical protein B0A50_04717 [Salinomyces thailandica]
MAEKRAAEAEEPPSKRVKVDAVDGLTSAVEHQIEQERVVGITAHVSPSIPGFKCVVKQRYTDFLVNEILLDGQVLHLTELPESKGKRKPADSAQQTNGSNDNPKPTPEEAPKPLDPVPAPETISAPPPTTGDPSKSEDASPDATFDLSSEDRQALLDIFGDETLNRILALYFAVLKHPFKKPRELPTVRSNTISEKSQRTAAHVAVRRIFASKLQTETLQDEAGIIAVKAAPSKPNPRSRGNAGASKDVDGSIAKGKLGWSELGGEYLHFTLYKENKDTMEALYFIASQLKIPVKNFQFAGTKDRRGVTVQRVAVFRIRAERLAGMNKNAKNWLIGGLEYKPHGLELGELGGNEFVLTLRDIHFEGEESLSHEDRLQRTKTVVAQAGKALKEKGYLNYYGLQRFGTFSTGTHVIGLKMLQGDLKGAVDSILTYSSDLLPENHQSNGNARIPQDDINRADAIRQWREGSVAGADIMARLPRRFQAEGVIMQFLSKREKKTDRLIQASDWQGALMQIQRNLRLMYVHAYQSLVWNTVAGKRWEMFGDRAVEGDLVIVGEKDGGETGPKEEVDEDGEPIVRPTGEDSAPSAEDRFVRARHLSKEEADSGKFDIFDIVLPLPGFDVLYPANAIGKFYEDFMGSEAGGKLDPHNMRRAWKDASLSGGYRKMMERPLKGLVECEVKEYAGEEQMVETDGERVRKAEAEKAKDEEADAVQLGDVKRIDEQDEEAGEVAEEKKIAVVMRFQLGSSQYATMALREMTKGGAVAYRPDFSTAR